MIGSKRPATVLLFLLPMLAVVALAAVAWHEAGHAAESELTRRGQALLNVLHTTIDEFGRSTERNEVSERARLLAIARRIETDTTSILSPIAPRLERIAADEQVGHIFMVNDVGLPIAHVVHPKPVRISGTPTETGAVDAMKWQHAKKTLDRLAQTAGASLDEGVVPNAFGVRERMGVALRFYNGSAVLIRAKRAAQGRSETQSGLQSVLTRLGRVPDVDTITLRSSDGDQFLEHQSDAPARRTARFTGTTTTPQTGSLSTSLTLSRARVEAQKVSRRKRIALWALLALAGSIIGLLVYRRMERARTRTQLQVRAKAAQEQRLTEMGALAGLVAHEISNPLNAISLELARLEAKGAEPALTSRIRTQLASARNSIESYLQLAHAPSPSGLAQVTVTDVSDTVNAMRMEAGHRIDFAAPNATRDIIQCDSRIFDHALRNLVRNAVTASNHAVRVTWTQVDQAIHVAVEDDGEGFPKALADRGTRLGESLRRGGHGLGLALARRFLENNGLELRLGSSPLGGAAATIVVPESCWSRHD